MAPLPCLQEVELIHLSRDIPHNKYSELCLALGYSYNQIQSILQKNRNDNMRAMEEILNMWNTEQADKNESRSILVKKLHDVKLHEFEQKLSKGEYPPKQQDPHEQEATPLQSSSGGNLQRQHEAHGQEATQLQSIPVGGNLQRQQEAHGQEATHLQSIPEIYSKKISESLTVQQCRKKLENKYLNQLCKIQMKPWDQGDHAEFKDMHTVVTLVTKDAKGKDTETKEILQGSVAKIFSTKVNGRLPARILISAPAGRGKTTAVAKMAYDWAHRKRGSALEQLPLLFVVKFRNTNHRTSIGEAIKSQLLSDVDDLTPEELENFIRKNQEICHIILDGLDEYAGISSSNRSLGSNIVSVIRWEKFPECRVLVTTRPHLENFFNQAELSRVYTKMWIEGFSQESSREYVDKFFASTLNQCLGHGLKVYLDEQPLINELVKTPLFCLMVCHLWSEGLLKTETATQTELLDSVNDFLMHHANARSESKNEITKEELIQIIRKLGKAALAGLIDDSKKVFFTPQDFRRDPAILDRACELGIVSKTTFATRRLPRSHNTTSCTTIEFYHKLVQEHSAGKYLAAKTKKCMLRLKISKLDRLLHNIKANIGDYENLLRFAAGTDNSLCIRIMEALLANSRLNESERYRIILDCSSETKATEGNVSSLVQGCVNAESMVLKAPTVYTVVGMQNLPKQLKQEVRSVKFEGSTLTTDVTSGLWSCLETFSMLHNLTLSDSSLSFLPSPPELLPVKKLSTRKVTSQSYEGLLSSLPGLEEVDITIGDANAEDISQIRTSLRRYMTGQELTCNNLHFGTSEGDVSSMSRKRIRGLGLLITEGQAMMSGVVFGPKETVIDLVQSSTRLMSTSLYAEHFSKSLNSDQDALHIKMWTIKDCQLSTEMTVKLWVCLRSFTSLKHISISDSSLSFPSSSSELPSVTEFSAERLTSQSYTGLLSSLPCLKEVDITIGDANTEDISQIETSLRRHLTGQDLTRIDPQSITSEGNVSSKSRKRMRGLGLVITECQAILSGVVFVPKETVIDLVQSLTRLMSASLYVEQIPLYLDSDKNIEMWTINDCQLSTKMTVNWWSCLRSFTSLDHLSISDSSLSFPPSPPQIHGVKKLSVERVTSQSYEGLLSSLPRLRVIDITIDDAERDIPQINAGLRRTRGQHLKHIKLKAPPSLPSEKKSASRETMRGLGFLIEEQTKNLQCLHLAGVESLDEESLVDLIECCRRVKTVSDVWFYLCGTRKGGKLESHLKGLHTSPRSDLNVHVFHDGNVHDDKSYIITHTR